MYGITVHHMFFKLPIMSFPGRTDASTARLSFLNTGISKNDDHRRSSKFSFFGSVGSAIDGVLNFFWR
jgi:hypothetical protein